MLVRPRMLSDNHRGQKKPTNLCFFRFEDSPKGFHGQWVIQVGEEVRNLLLNDSGKKMFAQSPAREYEDYTRSPAREYFSDLLSPMIL